MTHPPGPRRPRRPWPLRLALVLALVIALGGLPQLAGLLAPAPALAAPGLCVGPVCADEITRSAKHHWQLRLRVDDQRGHRERLVVDCRDGHLSPEAGSVERGYAAAVARRACRLAGEAASSGEALAGGARGRAAERGSGPFLS